MTVVASLGTALYTFTSTTSRNQLASMSDSKAYYVAESGGQYGIKRLVDCEQQTGGCATRSALLTELAAAPFVVSNAGQFTLQSFAYDGNVSPGYSEYQYMATGWTPDLSVSRSINYIIKVPTAAGVNIPFDGSGATLNADNWNVSGNASLDTANQKISSNTGSSDTQVSLDWNNANSTLPNLLEVWNESNGLMTYEAQIKVKLGSDHDVMGGLSFRLKTGGNTNISDDSFYGLSYLWCNNGEDLGSTFCPSSSDDKTYIVLWKQAANGAKTVLGKQRASTVSTSLVNSDNGRLIDWSTLVVRIQEQFNPATGVRENLIYSFAGSANINPKGTIHWDYTKYSPIAWESATFTGVDCSGGLRSFISDSTFLTTDFNTQPQDEIGVHAFGDDTAQLADLALRFNYNGGKATSCIDAATTGTISLTSSSYNEDEDGLTATITVRRTGGVNGDVGVSYATTSGGTATAGTDFTATSGTLLWTSGDSADKSFTINIADDSAFEVNETVNLAITNATGGATLGSPNTAVLTIRDNDGINVLNDFPTSPLASGTTALSGSLATSAGTNRLLLCSVTSELGSENSNYAVTGTYGGQSFTTIARTNGSNSRQHVWLGYVDEAGIAAPGRSTNTIAMTITAGSTPSGSNMYCGSYTGVDQTFPIAGWRTNVNSGSSTVSFGGNVAASVGGRVLYSLAANGASSTPPSGYTEHWDKATSGYSQSGGSKRITTTGSENRSWSLNTSERWGLAVVSLNPAAGYGNPGTLAFSASTYSIAENGGAATITASRTGGSTGAVGVSYATSTGGTATAGADFTTASGTLSWASGDATSKTFPVTILDDTTFEGNETVNLATTSPTGSAILGTPNTAVLTITENEAAPAITVLNSWPASPQLTATSGNLSGSFSIGSGTNRLLLVAVSCYDSSGSSGQSFSAQYGGKTLTQAARENSGRRQTWIGYLKEADIASRSGDTLNVTVSGTHTDVSAFVASYSYVNQTTPIVGSGGLYINDTNSVAINSTSLSAGAGAYGIYNWSGMSGITRSSDNESYSEHADLNRGGINIGVTSKFFSAATTSRPTVTWSSNNRVSVSFITLNKQ